MNDLIGLRYIVSKVQINQIDNNMKPGCGSIATTRRPPAALRSSTYLEITW